MVPQVFCTPDDYILAWANGATNGYEYFI